MITITIVIYAFPVLISSAVILVLLGSIATEGLKKEKRIKKKIIPTIDSKCSPMTSITN